MGAENQNKEHPFHRFLLLEKSGVLLAQRRSMARKLIGFDPETQRALERLSRDSGTSLQELANEAFADLMAKHHRPRTFVEA